MTSGFSHILCSNTCLTRKEVWPDDDTSQPSHPPHGKPPLLTVSSKGCRDVGEQTDASTTCNGVLADDFTAALGEEAV